MGGANKTNPIIEGAVAILKEHLNGWKNDGIDD